MRRTHEPLGSSIFQYDGVYVPEKGDLIIRKDFTI